MNNALKRMKNPGTLERLGSQLRQQREFAGIAQSQIRGMRQATVSKIENGKDVTLDTLVTYAASLGLEVTFAPIGQGQLRHPLLASADDAEALPRAGHDSPLDLLTEFGDLKDDK
jgi:transcriptional regulator with XRE-family HTH domain